MWQLSYTFANTSFSEHPLPFWTHRAPFLPPFNVLEKDFPRHNRKKQKFRILQKQPPEVFCKKDVLRNLAKFTGKHLYQGLFF